MLVIGLTGGIGSGKTTVAERLAALGAGVIDTDLLSREVTSPGSPALDQIAAAFGRGVIQPDGALDRAALRERVFADPTDRKRLESILHPLIKERMLERLQALQAPYAVLVIPLLFETGQQTLVDRVLVVDVPESIQTERVRERSGFTHTEIARIIASQIPRRERIDRADDLIDNSRTITDLIPQVQGLHDRYLRLGRDR